MKISAEELCALLHGSLEGDGSVMVEKPAKIEEGSSGDVCFLDSPKYLKFAYSTNASVLVIDESMVLEAPVKPTLIRVKNVRASFASILETYQRQAQKTAFSENGNKQLAFIHPTAKVDASANIGPFCYVSEGAIIGEHTTIYPGCFIGPNAQIGNSCSILASAQILHDTIIGDHCVVGANTVIGSDGFGFAPQGDGTFKKVPQTGNVIIENHVEIGSNTTIDRAVMGSTILRSGVKLDNLIQIAHNVEIGENTVIAAQTGISGSTKIGRNCMIGGQVGIVGHIEIADGTRINAQSGVAKTIRKEGTAITGSPAFDYADAMRSQVVFKSLPEMQRQLQQLLKRIEELESGK